VNWVLDIPFNLRLAALFALGAWLGTWLNLGIYRLAYQPRRISPWSAADPTAPRRRIGDRLPVLGWFGLRREAPLHGAGFWVRPLVLELFTGAIVAGLYWWEIGERGLLPQVYRDFLDLPMNRGLVPAVLGTLHWEFLAHVCLIAFMIVASFIDLDEKTIPDAVTLPGTLIGLILAAAVPHSLLPVVQFGPGAGGLGLGNPRLDFLTFTDSAWPWLKAGSLALGIGCLWLWCIGLMTRIWRTRRGLGTALRLFIVRLLRDPLTKWFLVLGLLGTVGIALVWHFDGQHWRALLSALVGMAVGGGLVWVVRIVASFLLGREAMGFGDVTLMAMIGAFVGWQPSLVIFFLAPFGAIAIGLAQLLTNRDREIRYGPFLCLATLVTIVRWADIWQWIGPMFELGWLIPATLAGCLLLMGPLLVIVRAISNRLRGE
jgi:leader peptidase (prepilin peptidase) / N-methyltransferase